MPPEGDNSERTRPMAPHQATPYRATLASVLALMAAPALAECRIEAGSVRILSNDFAALRLLSTEAESCATDTVTVTANATEEHKNIQVPALTLHLLFTCKRTMNPEHPVHQYIPGPS